MSLFVKLENNLSCPKDWAEKISDILLVPLRVSFADLNESKSLSSRKVFVISQSIKIILFIVLSPITLSLTLIGIIALNLSKSRNDNAPKQKNPEVLSKSEYNTSLPERVLSDKVKVLMGRFDGFWEPGKCAPFDEEEFVRDVTAFNERFPLRFNPEKEFGFIEKRDVDAGSQVFVRADLHGDLRSLIENLKALQKEGILDANFKCSPNAHLVFLGDYCDRGTQGMQILHLLMQLKAENPSQVTLIRGNHENIDINMQFGANDENLQRFVMSHQNSALLHDFYRRMTLSLYLSEKGEKRQYVQFTHGVFELYIDAAPILNLEDSYLSYNVSKKKTLPARIQRFKGDTEKMKKAFKTFQKLWKQDLQREEALTVYNWGDIASYSSMSDLGGRHWKISPDDLKDVMRIGSTIHKVKFLFRGHEHKMKNNMRANNKVISTTLSVGIDSPPYSHLNSSDHAYLLTTGPKAKDWKKQSMTRKPSSSQEALNEKQYSIYEDELVLA